MRNIRNATIEDELLLLEWVNDPDSIATKLENKNTISATEHNIWFTERLNDQDTNIWIITNRNNTPVGQIRFQKKIDTYFDVDIYLITNERRRGVAKKALNWAHKESSFVSLRALVKKNNLNSYNFFIRNGFYLESEDKLKWVLIKIN